MDDPDDVACHESRLFEARVRLLAAVLERRVVNRHEVTRLWRDHRSEAFRRNPGGDDPTPTERTPAMLVLSRKNNESVMIGDNVMVTVIGLDRGKVRLGFVAPCDVEINRLEVHRAKHVDFEVPADELATA